MNHMVDIVIVVWLFLYIVSSPLRWNMFADLVVQNQLLESCYIHRITLPLCIIEDIKPVKIRI